MVWEKLELYIISKSSVKNVETGDEEMENKDNILAYIKNNLSYINERNINLINEIYENKSLYHLSVDEENELEKMSVRCRQIEELRDSFGLDISELNPKEYIMNPEYAGDLFLGELEKWKYCFEEASSADADMAFLLGNHFLSGEFSLPMTVYASKWYKIAAEKGHTDGMYELGMCYRWGDGGEYAEGEKALYWFREAAKYGHREAKEILEHFDTDSGAEVLSLSALHGVGGEYCYWYKSKMLVEGYYQQADEGNAEAQYELGRQLVPGIAYSAFKRDTKKAIKYYEMAAANGVIDAMFNLSNLYKDGNIGLEPDLVISFEWMKKCMEAGDVEARFEVGKRLIEGIGTEVNVELGKKYVNEAADNGQIRAVNYLKNNFERQ